MSKTTSLENKIKKEFELIKFISRYSEGTVYSPINTELPEIINEESSTWLFSRIDEKGKQYSYSTKGGIDEQLFRQGLLNHFNEEKEKHENLERIDFIKTQIEFIDQISRKLTNKHNYVLSSLRRLFEAERDISQKKGKLKGKPSYTDYAMALHLRSITINKKGTGVNDGKDYCELFNLPSRVNLYNSLNDIQNGKILNIEKFKLEANRIIESYKL